MAGKSLLHLEGNQLLDVTIRILPQFNVKDDLAWVGQFECLVSAGDIPGHRQK